MNRSNFVVMLGLVCCSIIQANTNITINESLEDILIRYYDKQDCDEEEHAISCNRSADANREKKFIIIGLGCNCNPAMYTRKYNIRTFAFPFDWCLTPYRALYNFIKTDFEDYFKKENLVPSSKLYFTNEMQKFFNKMGFTGVCESYNWVLDKQSGMVYNHDFSSNSLAVIDKGHEIHYTKYMRRVARLYSEVNLNQHVYFIRYRDISKSQTYELLQLLKNKFPKTNFTLIVIGINPVKFSQNWKIPHVKNYYFDGDHDVFWQKLCNDIAKGNLQ